MLLRQIALLFTLLASFTGYSQFTKGTRMVGTTIGSMVLNNGTADIEVAGVGSSTSKITGYGVSINPSIGWFLTDKTAAGISLTINPTGQKTTYEENGATFQSDKTNNFNIGIGGFARNYFGTGKSLLPFGQVSLNGGISNLKTEGFFYGGSGQTAYKRTYDGNASGGFFANLALTVGFTKMVSDYTGIDFFAGYNFSYNKSTFKKTTLVDQGNNGSIDERQQNETTTKFTNHGFLLGVGFQIFLKGKK